MMTELPAVTSRIRLTRGGTFWNGVRVTPAELRERLRNVRAMPSPGFTLLEYEMWVGCPAIDRLRDTVSSSLACSPDLCGEMMVEGYHRPPRPRSARSEAAAVRQAVRDIERARRQAERALDAIERANAEIAAESAEPK
jgi:hypothetical protein